MSDKLDWDVALIGYDPTQRARYLDAIIDARQSGGPEPEVDCGRRKTDLVPLIDDDDGRRSFYEALLNPMAPICDPGRRHESSRSVAAKA
jgi:hypothetical protein